MAGTVKLERLGKPGVFINCDTFNDDAVSASNDHFMPTFRHVRIKSSDFYKLRGRVDTVRPLVESVFDDLVGALTSPLKPEEATPPQKKSDEDGPSSLHFAAESYSKVFEEFNQDFLSRRWGDGLPLVPPTPEHVQWMLSGTTRSPEEVIGKVSPKLGVATVEKIAVNAVMAGARPEYFPVILGIMDTILDKDFDHLHVLTSAGSFTFLIVVGGPIAREIDVHSGIGFLGHGWRANNTIGRAIRLTTLNIGRTWPAMNDMALTGRVSPHTFYVFAESPDSPWQPFHTTQGFEASQSCVTVASISSFSPQTNPYGGVIGTWTATGILDAIIANLIRTDRAQFPRWGVTGMVLQRPRSRHMIVLFPEVARELKKMGYNDQESLKNELYRRIAVRFDDLTEAEKKGIREGMEKGGVPPERKAAFEQAMKPGAMVHVLVAPDCIQLFVAGGTPGAAFSFRYSREPLYAPKGILTKPIKGATLTKAGR